MIKNVSIRNFKSIKELDFKAKRVNVFIGEPSTGKSNILEALGMFSLVNNSEGDVPIRYEHVTNLFCDGERHPERPVEIKADNLLCEIEYEELNTFVKGDQKYPVFTFNFTTKQPTIQVEPQQEYSSPIKLYTFKSLSTFADSFSKFLRPPYGSNLFEVLMANKELKSLVSAIVKEKGYRLGLNVKDRGIDIIKDTNDILYTYPYQVLSDTLQRIIFYLAVIETNQKSTILLDEPENNMFPFYTKHIAERIARDSENQYFLVTHNPYLLVPLVEKTRSSDLSVFVTYLEDYQTKLKLLSTEHMSELTDMDTSIFFNLDKLTDVEGVC